MPEVSYTGILKINIFSDCTVLKEKMMFADSVRFKVMAVN